MILRAMMKRIKSKALESTETGSGRTYEHSAARMIARRIRGDEFPVAGEKPPAGFRSPEFCHSRNLRGQRGGANREIGVPGESAGPWKVRNQIAKLLKAKPLPDLCPSRSLRTSVKNIPAAASSMARGVVPIGRLACPGGEPQGIAHGETKKLNR